MSEPGWSTEAEADRPEENGAENGAEGLPAEDVRRAVEEDRIFLVYQPVMSFEPRRLVGAEALARWVHRERGTVPPEEFIPVVEALGLMDGLSRKLLEEACAAARDWPAAGPVSRGKDLILQFNIAGSQLDDPEFPARVERILQEHAFPPNRLRLELDEVAVLDHPDVMQALASLGISLMVHDYGRSGRGLADEEALGIDALKIDRSVIRGLGGDPSVRETVRRAVTLGENRGLEVVAEGVESEAQVWHLQRLGCHLGQGFRLKAPMRADQFQRYCEGRWR